MAWKRGIFATTVLSLITLAASQQQAILQASNGQSLPACAQSCANLISASRACSGTASASQAAWICFCQSAYLTALRQSAATVCPTECTSQTDLAQISTWYNSNCGSDNGNSEHQGAGAAASSPTSAQASSTGVAVPSTSTSASNSGDSSSSNAKAPPQDWWSGHYQWIIMLIVLAILLPAVGVLGHWLKRRHDRRRDQNRDGFNAGITSRSGPMGQPEHNASGAVSSMNIEGSGRGSPARTRDAFMPYGYGYNRSESGLESTQAVHDEMAGDRTPDMEKEAAIGTAGTPYTEPSKRKSKRVLVRERGRADSVEAEKRSRF